MAPVVDIQKLVNDAAVEAVREAYIAGAQQFAPQPRATETQDVGTRITAQRLEISQAAHGYVWDIEDRR